MGKIRHVIFFFVVVVLVPPARCGDAANRRLENKTLGAQCQGCHTAHREKLPDGSYKMK
jgi:hypothetical protein